MNTPYRGSLGEGTARDRDMKNLRVVVILHYLPRPARVSSLEPPSQFSRALILRSYDSRSGGLFASAAARR